MGQNLSRKTAAAKRIFLPNLDSSEKFVKNQAYRGWKVAASLKISTPSELQNNYEKSNSTETSCRNKIFYYDKQLFQSKMGKLGTLLKIPESKLRKQSLVTARGHKEKSKTK